MRRIETHIAVLGAGIAGVQAACELAKHQADFVVIEAQDRVGGLAQTKQHRQWSYDSGVKALYSKHAAVMDYWRSLPVKYCEHERQVRVHHCSRDGTDGIDIEYPFENGIGQLPFEDKLACVLGYIEAHRAARPIANFREWILHRLGAGIADQFMLPYNRKIWDCPLEEISLGLVSGKIDPAPVEEIIRVALGAKIVGRKYQARFLYPRAGIGRMIEVMAAPVRNRFLLEFPVARICALPDSYELHSAAGDVVRCKAILSTMPLPLLGARIEPGNWPRPAWRHNHTRFYVVCLNQAPPHSLHWHFFAAPRFPFYRLTYMHNFSDRFAPCIVAEVTERGQPDERAAVIAGLERIGVRREWMEDILIERLAFTYPIPTLASDREKAQVIQFYEARHIYPLGRAGAWEYSNVDGVILQVWNKIPAILANEGLG
jgi:protoporphyrinogen oxidase